MPPEVQIAWRKYWSAEEQQQAISLLGKVLRIKASIFYRQFSGQQVTSNSIPADKPTPKAKLNFQFPQNKYLILKFERPNLTVQNRAENQFEIKTTPYWHTGETHSVIPTDTKFIHTGEYNDDTATTNGKGGSPREAVHRRLRREG